MNDKKMVIAIFVLILVIFNFFISIFLIMQVMQITKEIKKTNYKFEEMNDLNRKKYGNVNVKVKDKKDEDSPKEKPESTDKKNTESSNGLVASNEIEIYKVALNSLNSFIKDYKQNQKKYLDASGNNISIENVTKKFISDENIKDTLNNYDWVKEIKNGKLYYILTDKNLNKPVNLLKEEEKKVVVELDFSTNSAKVVKKGKESMMVKGESKKKQPESSTNENNQIVTPNKTLTTN